MKKDFRLFITSNIISQFGAGLILVALNWYIIDIYHLNSLIAIVANINVIAGILISIVLWSTKWTGNFYGFKQEPGHSAFALRASLPS